MLIVISVGTTRFDGLIAAALHADFIAFLLSKFEPRRLLIQHGNSPLPAHLTRLCARERAIEVRAFVPGAEMAVLLKTAEIVIAHGGAGTAFEVLRRGSGSNGLVPKTLSASNVQIPFLLVMCENEALQDGHQGEFIDALLEVGCSVVRGNVRDLKAAFEDVDVGRDRGLYRRLARKESQSLSSALPAPNVDILPQLITALLGQ